MVERTRTAQDRLIGLAGAAVAVTIWAGWIVATRQASAPEHGAALTPLDVALLRFSAPALFFAPIWLAPLWRRSSPGDGGRLMEVLRPRGMSWLVLLLLFGWGLPFALAASAGAARVDPTAFGALVPGVMPLWGAALAWLLFGEAPGRERRVGLALIVAAAALALFAGEAALDAEAALFLSAAALFWSAYAVGFARAGLTPIHAAGLVGALSCLAGLPLLLVLPSNLAALPAEALLWHVASQGILAGAVSVAAFGLAVARLGPAAAAAAALTPPLASLIGWAWLGEAPGAWGFASVLLAGFGVFLAGGGARMLAGRPRAAS